MLLTPHHHHHHQQQKTRCQFSQSQLLIHLSGLNFFYVDNKAVFAKDTNTKLWGCAKLIGNVKCWTLCIIFFFFNSQFPGNVNLIGRKKKTVNMHASLNSQLDQTLFSNRTIVSHRQGCVYAEVNIHIKWKNVPNANMATYKLSCYVTPPTNVIQYELMQGRIINGDDENQTYPVLESRKEDEEVSSSSNGQWHVNHLGQMFVFQNQLNCTD